MLLLNPIGLRPWSSARCFDTRTPCLARGDVTACVQSHEKVRSQEAFGPPAEISELTGKKKEREMSGRRKGRCRREQKIGTFLGLVFP